MFELKNKSAIKINSISEKETSLENLPVHTMKEDLKNSSNPDYNPILDGGRNALEKITPKQPDLSEKQKTSPFLSQSEGIKTNTQSIPSQSNESGKSFSPEEISSFHLGKFFSISLGAFLFLAIAAGAYYFWMTKNTDSVPENSDTISQETPTANEPQVTEPVVEEKLKETFSPDKPNYLSVDLANANTEQINTKLKEYSQKVIESEISKPVEFIVTNSDFSPVDFTTFSTKSEINLPQKTMTLLGPGLSLFIYNDNGVARTGVAIDARNEKELSDNIKTIEKDLPTLLKVFLLESTYSAQSPIFSDNQYENINLRYFNFDSPKNLSIDYAFHNNKLLIGTSKNSLRVIIDYLDQVKAQ